METTELINQLILRLAKADLLFISDVDIAYKSLVPIDQKLVDGLKKALEK